MKPRANKKAVTKKPKTKTLASARKIAGDKRFERRRNIGSVKRTGGTVHLNREQFNARHTHCITILMVNNDVERTREGSTSYGLGVPHKIKPDRNYVPDWKALRAVCDHPEDGMCGQNPTDEELVWINDRLAGKPMITEPIKEEANGHEPKHATILRSTPASVAVADVKEVPSGKQKFTFKLGGNNGSQL